MKKSTFLIAGKHAVAEALINQDRKVLKVFLTEESKKTLNRDNENKFEKIIHKYPTAALAVIKIKDGNWENLYNNQNELIDFITPKDLKY